MLLARTQKREHRSRIVAGLFGKPRKIDAAPVDARRRAGFESADRQLQFAQPRRQTDRGRIAGAPCLIVLQPDVYQPGEKCARRQHHGVCGKTQTELGYDPGYRVAVYRQIINRLLKYQ